IRVLLLSFLLAGIPSPAAEPSAAIAGRAARELIARLLPKQADQFIVEVIPAENGFALFEIESRDGRIVLRGNNGVAVASALNWYLKYYGHCQVSWGGDNLDLPDPLPVVPEKVRHVTPYAHRVYLNYCTFSYTAAWWDWPR